MRYKTYILIISIILFAGLSSSSSTIIDDFERGNLDPYDKDPGNDADWQVTTEESFEGSYSAMATVDWSNPDAISFPGDGLNYYPEEGDIFRFNTRTTLSSGMRTGLVFGVEGEDAENYEGYRVRVGNRDDIFQISGAGDSDTEAYSLPTNEWHEIEVEWDSDQITARLYDSSGIEQSEVSIVNGGYSDNRGVGLYTNANTNPSNDYIYWDNIRKSGVADDEPTISNPRPAEITGTSPTSTTDPQLRVDVDHELGDDVNVEFFEGSVGANSLGNDLVSDGGTAFYEWGNLNAGETYEWSVEACDEDSDCIEEGPWSFDVDTAEWQLQIFGSNTGTAGSSGDYTAEITNVGSTAGDPGTLSIQLNDDPVEQWPNIGTISDGDSIQRTTSVEYPPAFMDSEICARTTETDNEDCIDVAVSTPSDEEDWMNLVSFRMDITGPDSGLGWDMDSSWPAMDDSRDYTPTEIQAKDFDPDTNQPRVFFTDIYWNSTYEVVDDPNQDLTESDLISGHEPPMCGDDQREYLLEEMGQTENPEKSTGRFACADDRVYCHSRTPTGKKLFNIEEALQTNQQGESFGRYKDNEAVCAQRVGLQSTNMDLDYDPTPQWYSQDYANEISYTNFNPPSRINRPELSDQNICKENSLYGRVGVRWIDKDQIQSHPLAFNRGIDDSWNSRMSQMNHPYLISDPEGENWDLGENMIDNNYSPIPAGTSGLFYGYDSGHPDKSVVANPTSMDYGFCGGDDGSEYLMYQDSNTRYLDTDQSKIGVTSNPNSCILDNSELANIDSSDMESGTFSGNELQNERMIYQEGESVAFDSGDTRRSIACFGGQWWGDWPIIFLEDTATVDLGETGFTTFRLINPDDNSKTFDLGINPRGSGDIVDDLDQMVDFESTGTNDMTVTVPAQSSNTYRLEIDANREVDTSGTSQTDIEVFAQSFDGSLDGEDQVDIAVIDSTADGQGQTRSIPGLTIIQLAVIAVLSSLVFFRY